LARVALADAATAEPVVTACCTTHSGKDEPMTKAVFPTITRVEDIMSRDVVMLRHDQTLSEAADVLIREQIGGAPVFCGNELVGVVSKGDLLGAHPGDTRLEHLMTKAVYAVRPTDPAILAVQLIVDEGLHRVLVVDENKRLMGIVTPIDVCKAVRAGKPLSYSSRDTVHLRYTDLRV
jgi:CBS domain-containing protein